MLLVAQRKILKRISVYLIGSKYCRGFTNTPAQRLPNSKLHGNLLQPWQNFLASKQDDLSKWDIISRIYVCITLFKIPKQHPNLNKAFSDYRTKACVINSLRI